MWTSDHAIYKLTISFKSLIKLKCYKALDRKYLLLTKVQYYGKFC